MRVLYVHHTDKLAGSTWSLLYLVNRVKQMGVEPVVAVPYPGPAEDLFKQNNIDVIHLPLDRFAHVEGGWVEHPLRYPGAIIACGRWLKKYRAGLEQFEYVIQTAKPDIVHLNSLTLAPYAAVCSRLKIPVVVHVRESVVDGLLGVRTQWLKRLVTNHVDRIIYICEDNRKRLTGSDPKGVVIYNPVDFAKFDKNLDTIEIRQNLGLPENGSVILFAGGLARENGIIPFVKAMSRVAGQLPDVSFLLPFTQRDPSQRRLRVMMRKTANSLGIYSLAQRVDRHLDAVDVRDRVLRTGFRTDIERFFAIADVVVVPFVAPHFARPVIEAHAMAKPVVASRIGGIEEIITHEHNGLLVPPGDATELANAIIRVLKDAGLAEKLGQAGFEEARQRYALPIHSKQIVSEYQNLAD
ncbi:MAG: glycosyltransferase family 4 protein [Anaerolineae bacterium]|nr:glycosyltransferase family 4 protein [Anaerolineae bacterium]